MTQEGKKGGANEEKDGGDIHQRKDRKEKCQKR